MGRETVGKILLEFDPEKRNLLPALKKISAAFGYVSENDAERIADYFAIPKSQVYETATFYDQINTKKQPSLVIRICSGTNCVVNGSFEVIKEIKSRFGITVENDLNPHVKLEVMSCLGRCGEGPIMLVNGKVYENVTMSSVHDVLEEWL